MSRFLRRPTIHLLPWLAIGCSAPSSVVSPFDPDLAVAQPDATGGQLPLYSLGRDRRQCSAPGFRGFDFWVGQWQVYAPDPATLAGTNVITQELGGCAIEEHWTDQQGGRGRSLNSYDRGTGEWNQLWMDASGLALIIAGGTQPLTMTMLGDTPQGIGGPIITNRISWFGQPDGRRVRQLWEVSSDGRQTWAPVFDGDYRRAERVIPTFEVVNPFCASRPRYHWFDFLLGRWTVALAGRPTAALGVLDVAKDVSDCLVESQFVGHGYRGKAFAAFHFPTLTWHRTWIDGDGTRIGLKGQPVGASMVMTGQRTLSGGQIQDVRATWTPVSPERVDETWELSIDGGATWRLGWSFVLTK